MKAEILNALPREGLGKKDSRKSRAEGLIPGVVYGPRMKPNHLTIDVREFREFMKHTGEQAMARLKIGGGEPFLTVINEIQHHPVTDRILHIDFKQIPEDEPVEIAVPLHFFGESPGVHEGGLFMSNLHQVILKALPKDIPETIEVDISELDFDNAYHIEDLNIPGNVEILHDKDETVATVIMPREIEVEEEEEEVLLEGVEGELLEGEEAEGEEGEASEEGEEEGETEEG